MYSKKEKTSKINKITLGIGKLLLTYRIYILIIKQYIEITFVYNSPIRSLKMYNTQNSSFR